MVCKNSFRDLGFVYNDWIFHLYSRRNGKKKFMNAILTSIKQNATLVETDLGFSQRGQQRSSKSILGYEVIFCQLHPPLE